MTDENPPLTGDAAWRAEKNAIAKRNDAARKAGAERRAREDQKVLARQRAYDRHERENLPNQPDP